MSAWYKKHIPSIERKRESETESERASERAQVTTICQQCATPARGLWIVMEKTIVIYNNSQEKCTCQETEWWLSVCINLCSCLCWPSTETQLRPRKPTIHTKTSTHKCIQLYRHRGKGFAFPEAQSHMSARLNLVIISREVSFDLLFMSVLKLSSF